jgi:glyoxylase-like metal-dependent hydrolase (beta-lactamase superfamily II)
MKSKYSCHEYFPGIYHINDDGVYMTLMFVAPARGRAGEALLFDAGYGFSSPRPFITELLEKHGLDPSRLTVLVSHVHHDHLLGARWFDSFFIHQADFPLLDTYTNEATRTRVLSAKENSGSVPDDFDRTAYYSADFQSRARTDIPAIQGVDILHVPGHTPGSLVLYIPAYKLLLTADDWNPTTWLFFPEALPAEEYAKNMKSLLALAFEHVLCSHAGDLFPGERLRNYINGLTNETFAKGVPAETPYPRIKTLLSHPEPGTNFVFRG